MSVSYWWDLNIPLLHWVLVGGGFTIMPNNESDRQKRGQKEDPIYPELSINERNREFSPTFLSATWSFWSTVGKCSGSCSVSCKTTMNECRFHPDICDEWRMYIFMRCAPPFDENLGVSVFVGDALNLIFCKRFLRIFRFHPKQSELLTVTSIQKTTAPTSLRPLHSMEFNFLLLTLLFLCFFFSFHTSRSSSWALLWFCPAFCSIISHTRLDKHTLSCLGTHTHTHTQSLTDWIQMFLGICFQVISPCNL